MSDINVFCDYYRGELGHILLMMLHRGWDKESNPPPFNENKFPVGISGNIPIQE